MFTTFLYWESENDFLFIQIELWKHSCLDTVPTFGQKKKMYIYLWCYFMVLVDHSSTLYHNARKSLYTFSFPQSSSPHCQFLLVLLPKKKSFSIKLSKELRKREKEKLRLHRLNKLDAKMKMMMIRNIWRQLQLPMLFLLAKREHLSMCNPANSQEGNF